ncbi:probable xyloglucan galactosyltransferase GT20 [Momordica charantia]|uniref:Probable xyloglucan galactosyltransferase GT20 n=1 Tax=Momordica charantia TaxID=3673 RepID=A0A6J1C540_MOMCH|nr:probable xyloglucan galactosyltransferase GT20 [Momordica charantia]
MAISSARPKIRTRPTNNNKQSNKSVNEQTKRLSHYGTVLLKLIVFRIPAAAVFLILLVFLWSSSTTVISGSFVHLCVSSRKLTNNLYCLSAGERPNFEIPNNIRPINSTSVNVEVSEANSEPMPSDSDEIGKAMEAVEEQLRRQRSWMWVSPGNNNNVKGTAAECGGRGIYVYEAPAKFNRDLVAQCGEMVTWMDLCRYLSNEGLGEPIPELGKGWHHTHQYALEPIFHSRVMKHPCRVYKQEEAKLFYVPYYGGLDILRWHFKNVSNAVKDSLGSELVQWLATQNPWLKNSGQDHVFVLGKISWDFRRNAANNNLSWGTNFLDLPQLQNSIKLLIERQPWHENDIGIPHPTFFHPHSDDDVFAWQSKALKSERKYLVGFAGAARPDAPDNVRSIIIDQCATSPPGLCRHVDCTCGDCERPEAVVKLFLESEFCLQPPGDSPTRKSVFDSLVSGCIPVFFDPFTAYYQYPWHLPEDHSKYSVMIDKKELERSSGSENVVRKLMGISPREKDEMRSYIVYELMPGLVYGDSNNEMERFQDAYDIAINNLLQRVSTL